MLNNKRKCVIHEIRILYILCCLITRLQNGGMREGAYSMGGGGALILNFGRSEGRLFERGALTREFTVFRTKGSNCYEVYEAFVCWRPLNQQSHTELEIK